MFCLSDPVAVTQYLKSKGLTAVQGFVSFSLLLTYIHIHFLQLTYVLSTDGWLNQADSVLLLDIS